MRQEVGAGCLRLLACKPSSAAATGCCRLVAPSSSSAQQLLTYRRQSVQVAEHDEWCSLLWHRCLLSHPTINIPPNVIRCRLCNCGGTSLQLPVLPTKPAFVLMPLCPTCTAEKWQALGLQVVASGCLCLLIACLFDVAVVLEYLHHQTTHTCC